MQERQFSSELERPSEERRRPDPDRIDEALDETFPASDAPSWSPVTGVRVPESGERDQKS